MNLQFSIRWFFVIFTVVGIVAASLTSLKDIGSGIICALTLAILVYASTAAVFKGNAPAFGLVLGFVAYGGFAYAYLVALNPVADYLATIHANAMLVYLVHLMAGWAVGVFGAVVAFKVASKKNEPSAFTLRTMLLLLAGAFAVKIALTVFNVPWEPAYLLLAIALFIYFACNAVYRREPFAFGFCAGFVLYAFLDLNLLSVLNPVTEHVVGLRLNGRAICAVQLTVNLAVAFLSGVLSHLTAPQKTVLIRYS